MCNSVVMQSSRAVLNICILVLEKPMTVQSNWNNVFLAANRSLVSFVFLCYGILFTHVGHFLFLRKSD